MNNDLEIRKISLETLSELNKNNVPSHILLKSVLDKYDYLPDFDKALISKIVKGVNERKIELEYIINLYSKTPVKKMKPVIRIILEMGIYQILYMDVYDTVAVDSSVNLAKKKGFSGLAGFVNAILRNVVRDKESIEYPKRGDENYLSVRYSIPEHIAGKIVEDYGFEIAEKILKGSMDQNSVSVRFRLNLPSKRKEEILKSLSDKGAILKKYDGLDDVFMMTHSGNIAKLECFKSGEITIQDASSFFMCMNVPKGNTILDACAAPGGKSALLSERFPDAKITACDISADKLAPMTDGFLRMGLKNITVLRQDATEYKPEWVEKFDVAVADVPCSGLGVIGKKHDIRYRLTNEDFDNLCELQEKILENVSKYVKKGGYLVYSTCTINKDENIRRTDKFVEENGFSYDELSFVPDCFKENVSKGSMQLLQGINETDGFYVAVLKKND